jgi:hypothetical protein
MYGLDTLSFKELDPPAARRPLSDNNALKIAVSGVSRSPQRAHSDAITEHERLLRFQRECLLRNSCRSIPLTVPQRQFRLSSFTILLVSPLNLD